MNIRSLFLVLFLIAYPALSLAEASNNPPPTEQTSNETDLQTHDSYINSKGNVVHSPSKSISGKAPAGASAKCRDGTYSFSQSRRGTCSHHGGVSEWL
jgi:hypothetical protein